MGKVFYINDIYVDFKNEAIIVNDQLSFSNRKIDLTPATSTNNEESKASSYIWYPNNKLFFLSKQEIKRLKNVKTGELFDPEYLNSVIRRSARDGTNEFNEVISNNQVVKFNHNYIGEINNIERIVIDCIGEPFHVTNYKIFNELIPKDSVYKIEKGYEEDKLNYKDVMFSTELNALEDYILLE